MQWFQKHATINLSRSANYCFWCCSVYANVGKARSTSQNFYIYTRKVYECQRICMYVYSKTTKTNAATLRCESPVPTTQHNINNISSTSLLAVRPIDILKCDTKIYSWNQHCSGISWEQCMLLENFFRTLLSEISSNSYEIQNSYS